MVVRGRWGWVRVMVASLVVWVAGFAAVAGSALASPLEAPEVRVEEVTASTATLFGTLSPASPGEAGASYGFVYRQGSACKGAGETKTTEGLSLGEEHEILPAEPIAGLVAGSEYTVCVVVHNSADTEEVLSAPVHFLTGPPQTPETQAASEESSTGATLHGVLDPNGPGNPGSFEFLYRQSPTLCQGEGQGQTSTEEAMTGTAGESVEAGISGLLPGVPYTFCLLARNEAGETSVGNAVTFTTTAIPPKIVGEPQELEKVSSLEATNQTASSADLNAQIIPGAAAKYHFEYDTRGYAVGEAPHGTSTPEATVLPAGTSTTPVAVSQHVTGLSENTTYHWRLVIKNTAGKTESVDHTFVYDTTGAGSTGCPGEAARQARGSLNLPDCRAYEMVTPPEKNGALIGRPLIGLEPAISTDGTRIISSSLQCFSGAQSCIGARLDEGSPFEFVRTPTGWVTHPLGPAPAAFQGETYATWGANANNGTLLLSALAPTAKLQEDMWRREAGGKLAKIGPLEEEGRYPNPPEEPGYQLLRSGRLSRYGRPVALRVHGGTFQLVV